MQRNVLNNNMKNVFETNKSEQNDAANGYLTLKSILFTHCMRNT